MMISNRSPAVVVQYTHKGQTVSKQFTNPYQARRFYAAKLVAGANPTVHAVPAPTAAPNTAQATQVPSKP